MKIRNESQAVIMRKKGDTTEFLLLKRHFTVGEKLVQMRLVKGGIEVGETAEGAAKREIMEETGLRNVKIVRPLGGYEYEVDGVLHRVNSFLVEADINEIARPVSENEGDAVIDEVLWADKDKAIELLTFPNEQNVVRLGVLL
jgi:8-oxo-dGTP pyrophosphatase MutT (NUDIX family)